VLLNFEDSASWWADHVQPVSRGGQNDEHNIVLTCKRCNLMKSDMTYHEFLRHCLKVMEAQDPVIRLLKGMPTFPPSE
jgi:hypothetical protein